MGKAIENTATGDQPVTAELAKCRCGCGEPVQRLFKQGHDQRLISILAHDVVEGTGRGLNLLSAEEAELDIQERINRVVTQVTVRLSEALALKFYSAAMIKWATLEKRTQKAATKPVADSPAGAEKDGEIVAADVPVGLGAAVRVKVGRYVYDGEVLGMNQSGKVTAVKYTNKAGNEKTIAAPKEIKLV